jgi:glycosyltransferase involved in cell wall biosynthesis
MSAPLVSVCIPTFNMGAFVGQAVDSVLAQTVQDFEIVICDNCSSDDTRKVLSKYGDARVRYVLNETNLGMYGNFNRTLAHARGRFIKFLCADDRLEPTYLERALALFARHPSMGIVTSLHTVVDEGGRVIARHSPWRRRGPEFRTGAQMLWRAPWEHNEAGTPSHVMLRREVFQTVGTFDQTFETVNDWEMWLRVFAAYDAGFLRDYLVVIRHHLGQGSMRPNATLVSARDVVRLADGRYGDRPLRRRILLLRSGEVYLWHALMLLARGDRARAAPLFDLVLRRFFPIWLGVYAAAYAPVRLWLMLKRRYCLRTGRIWQT